jgi:NADH-quinone oxidoreductase subunit A
MPETQLEVYFPVILQALIACAVGAGMIGISFLLGKKLKNKVKDSPYECGVAPIGSARERFSVKFYLVAMIFILFDLEAIFLFPWVVVYKADDPQHGAAAPVHPRRAADHPRTGRRDDPQREARHRLSAHRDREAGEALTYQQVVTLTDRMDYLSNLSNNLCLLPVGRKAAAVGDSGRARSGSA